MQRRDCIALLLLCSLGSLRALALASPPDPLWVPGLYDSADHDDLILAAVDLEGSRNEAPPALTSAVHLVGDVLLSAPTPHAPAWLPVPGSRAPPVA